MRKCSVLTVSLLALAATSLSFAPTLHAQGDTVQSAAVQIRLAWMGDDAGIVTGQPCSVTETAEVVRTLADGTTLTRRTIEQKWRDADGRFRKQSAEVQPGHTPVFEAAMIVDPVSNTLTTLHLDRGTAVVFHLPDHGPGSLQKYVDLDDKALYARSGVQVKVEQLQGKTIAGVYAVGRRVTRIRPPGTIGNDRPVVSVSERWVSPDLKVLVASSMSDPRETQTRTVTRLDRADPDPSIFSVPPQFTVRDVPVAQQN